MTINSINKEKNQEYHDIQHQPKKDDEVDKVIKKIYDSRIKLLNAFRSVLPKLGTLTADVFLDTFFPLSPLPQDAANYQKNIDHVDNVMKKSKELIPTIISKMIPNIQKELETRTTDLLNVINKYY